MPDDANLLYEYALSISDAPEQARLLERAVALAPENKDIRFALGSLYVNGLNREDLGFSYLRRVFEEESSGKKLVYGNAIAHFLDTHGRGAEAQSVREQMKEYEHDHSRPTYQPSR